MFGGSLQTGQDSDSRRMNGDGGWMERVALAAVFLGVALWDQTYIGWGKKLSQ